MCPYSLRASLFLEKLIQICLPTWESHGGRTKTQGAGLSRGISTVHTLCRILEEAPQEQKQYALDKARVWGWWKEPPGPRKRQWFKHLSTRDQSRRTSSWFELFVSEFGGRSIFGCLFWFGSDACFVMHPLDPKTRRVFGRVFDQSFLC